MAEIFSGNYPEANFPNDVDDVIIFFVLFQIYFDSLKEQAEALGIVNDIQ